MIPVSLFRYGRDSGYSVGLTDSIRIFSLESNAILSVSASILLDGFVKFAHIRPPDSSNFTMTVTDCAWPREKVLKMVSDRLYLLEIT